jgi:hypothetical protein
MWTFMAGCAVRKRSYALQVVTKDFRKDITRKDVTVPHPEKVVADNPIQPLLLPEVCMLAPHLDRHPFVEMLDP